MQRNMRYLFVIAAALSWLTPRVANADHPLFMPNSWTTPVLDYRVDYTSENPYNCSAPNAAVDDFNYMPDNQALNMAQALDSGGAGTPGNPPGYHFGYTNLGFFAPDFDGNEPPAVLFPQVLVYDCAPGGVHDDDDCDNGSAPAGIINMPATRYCMSSERNIRRVIGHELMHHVQFGYIGFDNWISWGYTAVEANARMMEDMIYTDIDGDSTLGYWGEVKRYLDDPGVVWWNPGKADAYVGALGWKYAAERYGTTTDEPQYGVDFVRRFWENALLATATNSIDFPDTFRTTIRQTSPGTSLAEWFQDFSIANIAKEFDTSLIPNGDIYQYIDESDGNGVTYSNVKRTWTGDLPGFVVGITDLVRWSAAYMEANLTSSCISRMIAGWQTEGAYKAYAVLAVDGSNRVQQLIRGAGENNTVSFVQRSGSERYEKLIAVLIGREDGGQVTWQFDCGLGNVQIRRPEAPYKAYVGPPDDPTTLIIRLVVTGPDSLGNPTVLGLQPGDFEVYVGSNYVFDDEAFVVTGLYVQGEYWLIVRAPEKPDTNTYDLHVNFGVSLRDSALDAVSYEERILDQMIALDTSGSMADPGANPKIDAAINAASLFTDVAGPNDKLGLVSFAGDDVEPNDDATLQLELEDATDGHRAALKGKLAGLSAFGATSIGDGLDLSGDQFPISGSVLGEDWIVLLSDGMENEALYWDNVKPAITSAGIRINSIALGPDADQVLLQAMALDTGGDYYYVDTGTLARNGGIPLANRLADIWAASSETIKSHERLWEFSGVLSAPDTTSHQVNVAEGGIVDATFAVNWADPAEPLAVKIFRPDNSQVIDGVAGARIYTGATHVTAHVGGLSPGTWTVQLTATSGNPDYIGVLAGRDRQGASLKLFFTEFQDNSLLQSVGARFLRGLEQPILGMLIDPGGAVGGASVRAEVEHPDGTLIDLPLFDDGEHGDGNAGDGVYGNHYTRTTVASETDLPDQPGNGARGSYNVVLRAQGTDNQGQNFQRIRKGSFQVFDLRDDPPPDTDGDRMPDAYENLHPCLDVLNDDADKDADEDRLENIKEWEIGTDPCHPDTDRGGESDWSETNRSANPFDPDDDALPRPIDVEVIDWTPDHLPFPGVVARMPQPNANWIRYPVNSAYKQIHLLRSLSALGPFAEVAVFDAAAQGGQYYDTGLINNQTYYYKVQPDDLNGNLGTPSPVFSGTPKLDPISPVGSVLINDGASTTTSTAAVLSLASSSDTTEMLIANEGSFASAVWQPFDVTANWGLSPDPVSGIATVFVKFRDPALNESNVYHASIEVLGGGGTITGVFTLSATAVSAAIFVQVAGQSNVQPAFTNALGAFELGPLATGFYDLVVTYPGYLPLTINNVLAREGVITDIGEFILEAIDTDDDGVVDINDNCTLVANADQRNTDGDAFGNICDPDLNNDGNVNFPDLNIMKGVFFTSDPDADLTGDGIVNFADLGIMAEFFFGVPGPAGVLP